MKAAIREAAILLIISACIGFAFTASFQKGFFGPERTANINNPPESSSSSSVPATISFDQAMKYFMSDSVLFVDARHEFDFKRGHIKNAMNIPVKEFSRNAQLLSRFPKDKLIITYCDGAECNSSIELALEFHTAGYSNVKIFFGGWQEWDQHNAPIER